MKSVVTIVGTVILFVGTLVGGYLHGSSNDRTKLMSAAAQLERPLPARVGNWQMMGEEQRLGDDEQQMLQCPAYIFRAYEHTETGDVVFVALLLGPTGPIAVHTPEICFSSQDYAISGNRQEATLEDASGKKHSFWEIFAKSKHSNRPAQRVFYAWTTGSTWEATARPRYAFGGTPYLYKLQLAGPPSDLSSDDFDPCKDFLAQFLVQAKPRIIDSRPSPR